MKKAWNDIKDSYNTSRAVAKNMKQFENEQKAFKKEFANECLKKSAGTKEFVKNMKQFENEQKAFKKEFVNKCFTEATINKNGSSSSQKM